MTGRTTNPANILWEAAKQQGPAFASALTVAVVVIVFFHAPVAATLAGCGLALVLLFARTVRRLRSS